MLWFHPYQAYMMPVQPQLNSVADSGAPFHLLVLWPALAAWQGRQHVCGLRQGIKLRLSHSSSSRPRETGCPTIIAAPPHTGLFTCQSTVLQTGGLVGLLERHTDMDKRFHRSNRQSIDQSINKSLIL